MITIDLETRPDSKLLEIKLANITAPKNYKDAELIKKYIATKKAGVVRDMSLDPDYAEIACLGCKVDDEPAKLITLKEFGELMKKHPLITFNGKNFDLPVIIKFGIKKGLDLPYKGLKEASKKWNAPNHIDLIELLSFNGQYKSLDEYLQIYLGIKKTPCDFATCSQEELKKHCLEDVENTYKLFKLFNQLI